jgi:hypothetical protein
MGKYFVFIKSVNIFLVVISLSILSSSCKTRRVSPTWTAEIRWCHDINLLCLSDSILHFNAFISKNESLRDIDFETLNREQKAKFIQIDDNSEGHEVVFCLNTNNGEYINTQDSCVQKNISKTICNCSKVFNPFKPNKCESEIIRDYKGYRITVEVKSYIWRTGSNKKFTFNVYLKDNVVFKIPVNVFGSFITTKTSIYFNWGPVYRKQFITKYDFDDLIPH